VTMEPGLFLQPKSADEALHMLFANEDAKLISGGATLVAMMNAGVIEPTTLISLSAIPEMNGISSETDGTIRIGATTRHRETAGSPLLKGGLFVVRSAAGQIANATVRNMGTIGGSISFADPGLDYPPALVAAEASVEIASIRGRRRISAREFFTDWYTVALEPGEMVVSVYLPSHWLAGHGCYIKHARVSGDYATVSVALCLQEDGAVSVAVGGCGPRPIANSAANAELTASLDDAAIKRASDILRDQSDPLDDVRGTANYRRSLITGLLRKAVRQAETSVGSES
jgi:carbon-monoxide dehydrogenase medium subunit